MRFLKLYWFKHIFIITALFFAFIKCTSYHTSKDRSDFDSLVTETIIDSNKINPFYDPKFKYYGYDTIIEINSNEYQLITKKRGYQLFLKILKNNNEFYSDSTELFGGPFSVDMENFNDDEHPDLRIDYRNNKNTITQLFLWNTDSLKFLFLEEYHDVTIIKPNYFMSFNIYGANKYSYGFCKIDKNDEVVILKSYYIDYNNENEKGCYIETGDKRIYTGDDIDSCYKIVEKYRMKIKDAL